MEKLILIIIACVGLLFFIVVAAAGWCMDASPVPESQLQQLQTNMTMDQVIGILGEPKSKYPQDSGAEAWSYSRFTWSILELNFATNGLLKGFAVDR